MERINHPTAVDIGGGRRGFRSKDTIAGVPGTVATAAHLNATQEEMMAIIERAGFAPSGDDFTQIAKSIRSRRLNIPAVGGTANALTLAFDPALISLAEIAGADVIVKPNFANTGAVTVAGLPLTYRDGRALFAGELIAGQYAVIRLNAGATGWLLGSAPLQLGTTQLRDQRSIADLNVIGPGNDAGSITRLLDSTVIGQVTLPAGHVGAFVEGTYYAPGGTNDTTMWISLFMNDGTTATFLEYQYNLLDAGKFRFVQRAALPSLDKSKSHTFTAVGAKTSNTGIATPPSGNLQVLGVKV